MTRDVWLTVGDKEVLCKAPIPDDLHVRAWYFENYTAKVVQAIGRVRGARHTGAEPLQIRIFGGLPLVSLEQHGIDVSYFAEDGQTRVEYNEMRTRAAMERTGEIAALIADSGRKPTYSAIRRYCQQIGKPVPRYEVFKRWRQNHE